MQGQRIDKYRLVRQLGEGGMGVVYEAVREDLGGRFALKILRPEYAANKEFAARFFNEARAANVIEHPGVVRVFDYGQLPNGVAYLAMEYLDGESLAARMERTPKFSTDEVLRLGRQIASGVAAAHDKKIIHRDLKPENIMLVKDVESSGGERVKLLDFGIAKLVSAIAGNTQTKANILMGTPIYMAPEQCRGTKGVGERTDVYALGVLLYQMLAGRPPFVGDEPGEYFGMHMFKEPPPLRQFAPQVPERLHALVHSMLDKEHDRRPAMAEVTHILKSLGQGNSDSILTPKSAPQEDPDQLTVPFLLKPKERNIEPSGPETRIDATVPFGLLGVSSDLATVHKSALPSQNANTPALGVSAQTSAAHPTVVPPPPASAPEKITAQTEPDGTLWQGTHVVWLRTPERRRSLGIAALSVVFLCGAVALWLFGLRKPAPVVLAAPSKAQSSVSGPVPVVIPLEKTADPRPGKPPPKAAPKTFKPAGASWTDRDIQRGLDAARSKAKTDLGGALGDAQIVAEASNSPAAWQVVGTFGCRLHNLQVANEALRRLTGRSADLIGSMLFYCKSRGYIRGRDGRLVERHNNPTKLELMP